MLKPLASLVALLMAATVRAGAATVSDWGDLPASDPGRRAALVEAVVRDLRARWDVDAGGIAPEPGAIPSFAATACGLVALFEAPPALIAELGIPLEVWVEDAVAKMAAAQVTDPAEADPGHWPHGLYGSVVYPGWLPEALWPRQRAGYEWDPATPPPLATLFLRHRDRLPAQTASRLESLLWRAADGALRGWYAVRELDSPPEPERYWRATAEHLLGVETLILGGELAGHLAARRAGLEALDAFVARLRAHGVDQYASPDATATQLDALGHLAQESSDHEVRRLATAAFLYLWADLALTLTDSGGGNFAMGGPAAEALTPLAPTGAHRTHLYLAGWPDAAATATPRDGWRATLERRPPAAITALAVAGGVREATACWGDRPGEDRSWRVEPGLLVGAASASFGPFDRVLAVDLPPPAARVHLSSDRGTGDGGLPGGAGSGHTLMFTSAARSGRALATVVEAYPPTPEERVTLMLFLPADGVEVEAAGVPIELPPAGSEREWPLTAGDWVAVGNDDFWVVATCLDRAGDTLLLRCPAAPVDGARVLRLEVHPEWQGQPIATGLVVAAVPRADAPNAAALHRLLAGTAAIYRGTPEGLELEVVGGLVAGRLRVVHDPVRHAVSPREPDPSACGAGAPLVAPGLAWQGTQLSISSSGGEVSLDLAPVHPPRRALGRQGG
jgi:hypothetical protein